MCQYKNIFGKPNEGIHAPRILGVAVVDLILTLVAAYFIAQKWNYGFWKVLLALIILGIVAHWVFCVDTALNRRLFGKR